MAKRLRVIFYLAPLFATGAHPHHNASAHYLVDQSIDVAGVVTEFRLTNPHARIYFEVTDESGRTEAWMAEGDSAISLKRNGWTVEQLKVGDHITITGRPSRDGSNLVEWRSISLADGSELFGGNGQPIERMRVFEERLRQYRQQQNAQP